MIKIYKKTKRTTDIWLLMSFAVFIYFLISLFSSLESYYNQSQIYYLVGEYFKSIVSWVWIYIAYRFISLKNSEKVI